MGRVLVMCGDPPKMALFDERGRKVSHAFELTAFLSGRPVDPPEHLIARYPMLKEFTGQDPGAGVP